MATATLNYDSVLPDGITLHPFQTVGVAYSLVARAQADTTKRCKGSFVADEMGLGKTIQALVAMEAAGTFPAVVVCPASLKENWRKEIARFLPHRSVTVLGGRGGIRRAAEITICNFDIVGAWLDNLTGMNPRTLIIDESHYCANLNQRTIAVNKLAASVDPRGLLLALTGTPLLNRPKELVTQLQILGRLQDVAPTPTSALDDERSWIFTFMARYGNGDNLLELHDRLVRCCYVRRQRQAVVGLKDTQRVVIPLALNGALDTYRAAEADFIGWLYENKDASAARRALKVQGMAKMNGLRRLAGLAKVERSIEWIDNFLASNPGRSLVVFAYHVDVQHALADHFACPTILGGQKDVEEGKAAFQAGEHRVIVCSYAAKEGHTLTRAHDVVFIETGWTPGGQQQAEDRANRIGQEHDCFAWYLQAADTIDQRIYDIITEKRVMAAAAIEGRVATMSEDTVADSVMNQYLTEAAQ